MKRIIIFMSILINGLFGYMLYKADYSVQELRKPDLENKAPRLPNYLISYADGDPVFFRNQNALAASAQNKGFDFILNYRKPILDKAFQEKYADILNINTGAGLWLWKPYIFLQTMQQAPENALIFYADVGFVYVRDVQEWVDKLSVSGAYGNEDVVLMNVDDYHNFNNTNLLNWLPRPISKEWGLDKLPKDQIPKFIESGLIVARNTPNARAFMQKWLDICARRDYAFMPFKTDELVRGFTYDQSLLSIVAYKYPQGVKIIPKSEMKKYTVFHHRHPGNNKPVLPLQVLPLKQIREWAEDKLPNLFLYIGF
ncbi:MAG: hypothetical protein ACKOAD_07090 [Gammaproteobacteria bacterium]